MHKDTYGQMIFNEEDLIDLIYQDPDRTLKNILVNEDIKFDPELELDKVPVLKRLVSNNLTIEEFDQQQQSNWYMPQEYKDIDIAKWVLDQCATQEELQRAGEELLLYQERGLLDLLRYLKYLVDTMRVNNIVWGVGRGSSVASFVLFLIGVHKINSLYYDLSIDEFLR